MKTKCLQCGYEFELNEVNNDRLGWHTVCPKCKSSFDIGIENLLLKNGTKVKFHDGRIGIIDGNDADDTETFENINYYVCLIEFTHKEIWSNDYIMLRRCEIEVI